VEHGGAHTRADRCLTVPAQGLREQPCQLAVSERYVVHRFLAGEHLDAVRERCDRFIDSLGFLEAHPLTACLGEPLRASKIDHSEQSFAEMASLDP